MPTNTKNIDDIFSAAVAKGASDIHLVVGLPPVFRIDGRLEHQEGRALTPTETETLSVSLLTAEQKERFVVDRELDLGYEIKGLSRFRVNLHWEKDNAGLVARVVSQKIPTMEELNMPPITYDLCRLKQGLVLVTGPTGMGKSTTLAAMINMINTEQAVHLITLED